MKRLVALLIAVCLSVSPMIVVAGELDLSNKSIDELLLIQKEVEDALFSKGGKVLLPFGVYHVGKDIAAGNYLIEPHNASNTEYLGWSIVVYKSESAIDDYHEAMTNWRKDETAVVNDFLYKDIMKNVGGNESFRLTLKDGQVMELIRTLDDTVELTIEKAEGLFMN